MSDITLEWNEFQKCSELLRQKIADAQLLIRAIVSDATVNNIPVGTPPSEPPNEQWESFPIAQFSIDPNLKSLRSVWHEWKHGLGTQPSVEYMIQRFGSLNWISDSEQRQLALVRGKIVQEIEYHLEHGRELEEIFVVGALQLEHLGDSMPRLAAMIQKNMEQHRATFFEDADE